MNKELEEAIEIFKELEIDINDKEFIKSRKIILNYIANSTPNNKLEELIAEMRKDGSNYWADRIKEIQGERLKNGR